MEFKNTDDAHLVTLLRDGNALAFKELYDRYWLYSYRLAVKKLGREDLAQEMAQQLFENLWDKRDRLIITNIKAYLTISLKNLIIDYVRRNIREESYLDHLKTFFDQSYGTVTETYEYSELSDTVTTLLSRLPEKTRQVFELSRFEYYTIPEIAQQLNLSEKAIEYHLTKSLRFLRANLREYIIMLSFLLLS